MEETQGGSPLRAFPTVEVVSAKVQRYRPGSEGACQGTLRTQAEHQKVGSLLSLPHEEETPAWGNVPFPRRAVSLTILFSAHMAVGVLTLRTSFFPNYEGLE